MKPLQKKISFRGSPTKQGQLPPTIQEDAPLLPPGEPANPLWPPRSYEALGKTPKTGWRERLSDRSSVETWEFPGWGGQMTIQVTDLQLARAARETEKRLHASLGEWRATAIGANDMYSTCLYLVGLVTVVAGKLAPLVLLVVGMVLSLLWGMYGEAISALPFNGGTYNVLINTSSKLTASLAGTLTLITYVADGVISAALATKHVRAVEEDFGFIWGPMLLLGVVGVVATLGIRVSSSVALVALCLHIVVMTLLCITGLWYAALDPSTLLANLRAPYPDVDVAGSTFQGSLLSAAFFGYATSMLGFSGYETSAQFVQEQAPGVFRKTLRNMWLGAVIFNPLLAVTALGVLPMEHIVRKPYTSLVHMGSKLGVWLVGPEQGHYIKTAVAMDAALVLAGSVLAAYVGAIGLVERMAADRVLPQFFLKRNAWLGTTFYTTLFFFVLCASLVLVLWGDIDDLSGVYSFSFLGVLASLCVGVMRLKFKRPSLPREVWVPGPWVVTALLMVLIALLGNLMGNPDVFSVFCYFVGAALAIFALLTERARILRLLVIGMRHACPGLKTTFLEDEHAQATSQPAVFFCKKASLHIVNKAIRYVMNNEQTRHLLVVHCCDKGHSVPTDLAKHVTTLDTIYPRIKATLVIVEGPFGPAMVQWLSRDLNIPKNMMFISCPDERFAHKLGQFEGVRVIAG